MKKLFSISACALLVGNTFAQNISVNTSGAAAAAANMFEVTQASATNNTVGIFAKHSGAATNAYAIWAEATGATNKYAIVVPSGGGYVGIGNSTPATFLELQGNNVGFIGQLRLSATDYTQISFYNSGALTANAANRLGDMYYDIAGTALHIENNVGNKFVNLNQSGGNVGIGTSAPAEHFNIVGVHGTTQMRLTLPAAANGLGTGDVNLQIWASEPGVTWDAGGIGTNVLNNGAAPAGFGRPNTALGQAYIRFVTNGGAMAFNTTNNAGTYYQTMYMTGGNVGIGTTVPGAKLSFQDLNNGANTADGITWYSPAPTAYGIFRTPGAFAAPNYQQLSFAWQTGIVIDGGSAYGLSGTVLQPGAGNVGIGITAPLEKLHVVGNTRVSTLAGTGTRMVQADANGTMLPLTAGTATQVLLGTGAWGSVPGGSGNYIQNQTTVQATSDYNISGSGNVQTSYQLQGVNVLFNAATDVYGNIRVIQNNSTALQDGMYINYNSTGGAAADLRFYANGLNERMRILASNGNVGIGTLAPTAKLHINAGDIGIGRIDGGDVTPYARFGLSNGWEQYLANNAFFNSATGQWNFVNGAGYGGLASTMNQISGTINFQTTSGGVNPITWVSRMYITNAGNIGMGTTTPACKLQVIGRIMTDNMNQTSDMRLKKNIVTIDNALSKITSVRGVYFNWKDDAVKKRDVDTTRQIGVIAQEIEKIFPQLVHTDNEGYKSVEYSNLVAVLIEAIKEQQKQIDKLEARSLLSSEESKNLKAEIDLLKLQQKNNQEILTGQKK